MHAYIARTDTGFELTVFAETQAQAVTLFCIHHEVVMDVMPIDFEVSEIGSMGTPIEQALMDEALASDIIGVGHYLPGRSWLILPPDVVVRLVEDHAAWHELAVLKDEAPVRLYRFFRGKKVLFVFARHLGEASDIVTAWREQHHEFWKRAGIDPNWASTRSGIEAEHLREALSRRQPGVGTYEASIGWTIEPYPRLRLI